IGWSGLFLCMAGLMVVVAAITIFVPERTRRAAGAPPPSFAEILSALLQAVRAPGGMALIGFLVLYKLGESASDAMWKPFLVDAGLKAHVLGRIVGTGGVISSI